MVAVRWIPNWIMYDWFFTYQWRANWYGGRNCYYSNRFDMWSKGLFADYQYCIYGNGVGFSGTLDDSKGKQTYQITFCAGIAVRILYHWMGMVDAYD